MNPKQELLACWHVRNVVDSLCLDIGSVGYKYHKVETPEHMLLLPRQQNKET